LRNPERVRTILRAWSEYERLIAQLGAIDPADLLLRAAAIIDGARAPRPQPPGASPGGQIVAAAEVAAARGRAAAAGEGARAPSVLAGFYDMTGAQLAFSDALDRAGLLSAIFIPVG